MFQRFPTRLIDDTFKNPKLPSIFDQFISSPTTCSSVDCRFPSRDIEPDPTTDVERESIAREYLLRDFEERLRIESIRAIELVAMQERFNESRIYECLLLGLSLDQISSPTLVQSTARRLVRMVFNRIGCDQEGRILHHALIDEHHSAWVSAELALLETGNDSAMLAIMRTEHRQVSALYGASFSPDSSEFN